MAELSIGSATTTDITAAVQDFQIETEHLDQAGHGQGETWYDFPESNEYLGYYKQIPELKAAVDALSVWSVGKGVEADSRTVAIIENWTGWGEDTFQSLMKGLVTQMKVMGDAFAEIIRTEDGRVVNLKPLYTGDMRVVVDKKGMIKRYEQRTPGKNSENIVFQPENMLHLCNQRFGGEIHGISVVEASRWVIDARNEALKDQRLIKHRDLALGIAYYDTDDTGKISFANTQIEKAVKNGEMLGLPQDTVKIDEFPSKTTGDRLEWIRYLEGFFYQIVGVPPAIANPQGFSEASSKVGFLTFEPIYVSLQTDLEADLWNQLAIRVKFNRPPSLSGVMQEGEQKNSGQTGFQQSEVTAQVGRVE